MNNPFSLDSSFDTEAKGFSTLNSFMLGGNLFGSFEMGGNDEDDDDDDFDDVKASDAIDYADMDEAIPEEELEPQPYFTSVPPYLEGAKPEQPPPPPLPPIGQSPFAAQASVEMHQQMEREKEMRLAQERREKEKEIIEREKQKEREKEKEAEREKEKEREKNDQQQELQDKHKDALDALPVILPPLVLSVLSGEAKEATPEVHQICSTLRGPNGPILKFSELFAPEPKVIPIRTPRPPSAKPEATEEAIVPGSDEEELFDRVQDVWFAKPKDAAFEIESSSQMDWESETNEEPGQPMKDSEELAHIQQQKKVDFVSLQSEQLVGAQLRPWEHDIIWDEGEEGKRPPVPSRIMLKELFHGPGRYDMEEDGPPPSLVESTADIELGVIRPVYKIGQVPFFVPPDASREDQEQPPPPPPEPIDVRAEQAALKKAEWSLFPVLNDSVDKGDWLEAVVWDDQHIPEAAANNPLILDMNDKEMLFEENVKHPPAPQPILPPPPPEEKTPKGRKRRQKRDLSEIESIIEEGTDEHLDPFNYSMDSQYKPASGQSRVRQPNMGRAIVQHSLPALKLKAFRTHLTPEELRLYHRPRTKYPPRKKIKIMPSLGGAQSSGKSKSRSRKPSTTMRRMRDLSGKDGRVVLAEYLEESPPLVMNVGMGTKLLNYYRKRTSTDLPTEEKDDGETVLLEQSDETPFVGDIQPGQMIQSLDNNLFRAPIVQHKVPMVDFLLVRSKDNKAYIREISALYAVGQTQPLTEVPAPNSRSANNFVKNRLQAFIYRLFKSRQNSQPRLRIADICAAFPDHSETSIRKRLKDCADFQRGGDDSGWWTVKKDFEIPSEDELRSLVTPENVCAYESMLAGIQHLADIGVDNVTNAAGAPALLQQIIQEVPRVADIAEFVKEEILLSPWNISNNYISVMQGKGMFQLSGLGDPTRCGDGFSFMKVPHKVFMVQQQQKSSQPKHSVTGTDADLRKLSLENARLVLLKFGVSDEVISQLTRWERIDLVRKKSSAAAAAGDDPSLCKFARGAKHSVHQQHQQYKDECQEIFDRHMQFLGEVSPDVSSDEESDEEIAEANPELKDLAGEMEDLLEASASNNTKALAQRPSRILAMNKRQKLGAADVDEEADKKEFQAFMESEIKGGGTAPATPMTPGKPFVKTIIIDKDAQQFQEQMSAPANIFATPMAPAFKTGKKKKYIKRTVTKKGPDGMLTKTVEIIRDPAEIEEILKKKAAKKTAKRNKAPLTPEEEAKKIQIRKERRRLQEKLRRLKRNKEKQRIFKERMLNGSFDGSLPNSKVQLRCGACGMWGHMRTNRNCPFFTEPVNPPPPPKQSTQTNKQPGTEQPSGLVKVEGTKLRFAKAVISSAEQPKQGEGAATEGASSGATSSTGGESLILRISTKNLPKKRKAASVEEPGYVLHPPKAVRRQRQYKAGRGAGVELANLLEKVWNRVVTHQFALPFSRPVLPKEAPDYYDIIKRPMDLSTIKDKIKTFQYLSRQDLLADMKQIQANCWAYNQYRNPHLPPMADLLYTICEDAVKDMDPELKEVEDLVNPTKKQDGTTTTTTTTTTPSTPANGEPRIKKQRTGSRKSSATTTPAATPPSTPNISAVPTPVPLYSVAPTPTPTTTTTFTAIAVPTTDEQKLPPVRIRIKREDLMKNL